MARNKVVYGNTVLIDLTADTVTAAGLLKGQTAHDRNGDVITGTMEAGPGNCVFCKMQLTAAIGGSTGEKLLPITQEVRDWLRSHYTAPGLTLMLHPCFQQTTFNSVMATWAGVQGMTRTGGPYGMASYNGTSSSAISTVTTRVQDLAVTNAQAKTNFAIRVNADGDASVWFNSATYYIRPGVWNLVAWCDPQ